MHTLLRMHPAHARHVRLTLRRMYAGAGLYSAYMLAFIIFRNMFLEEEFYHMTRHQVHAIRKSRAFVHRI